MRCTRTNGRDRTVSPTTGGDIARSRQLDPIDPTERHPFGRRRFLQGAAATTAAAFPILRAGSARAGGGCDLYDTPPSFMGVVPDPESVLGFPIGTDEEVSAADSNTYLQAVAASSDRVREALVGHSVDGRPIRYAVVGHPDNITVGGLEAIRQANLEIRDPETRQGRADELARTTPAFAWMTGNVHGSEESGADAALQLLYELADRDDCVVDRILDELVIFVIPVQNPDGRVLDQRRNAYGFDLNRDFFARAQVETDDRVELMRTYPPVLLLDHHEFGYYRSILESERQYDTSSIERELTVPDSNRRIIEELKAYADEHERETGRFPKTLVFAVNDMPHTSHADALVEIARDVFGKGDDFVAKITGTVDRPLQRIKEFRNRPNPHIAITVDLLTTGVDIPDLEFIVLLRPVKSRSLFEQMLGRGTRLSETYPDIARRCSAGCRSSRRLRCRRRLRARRRGDDSLDGLVLTTEQALVLGLAVLGLALLVGFDMHRQGRSGIGWGLFVLVLPPVGLVAWLFVRDWRFPKGVDTPGGV